MFDFSWSWFKFKRSPISYVVGWMFLIPMFFWMGIKQGDRVAISVLVVFIAVGAFWLGRL